MESAPKFMDNFVFDQDEQIAALFDCLHVVIEIVGGKYDGWELDSRSNDPIDRELVRHFYHSNSVEVINRVEGDCGEWIQVRTRT